MEDLIDLPRNKLPRHVGIIPDGNRRWARQNKVDTKIGHITGYEALKNIILNFFNFGIHYLSVYCLSIENVRKRPPEELKYIYKIIMKACETIKNEPLIVEERVKVNVIGRISLLPKDVKETLIDLMEFTKDHEQNFLNLLIMYDGQEELIDGIKKMLYEKMDPRDITRDSIRNYLYSNDIPEFNPGAIPELDYIIRTGMDDGARISGFLLWDASYAEFKFRNDYWPDYNKTLLIEDLKDFVERNRRLGK
ncbi:MAG: polyprenyl diphosphate synthase [Promethearchaeota archaeon]